MPLRGIHGPGLAQEGPMAADWLEFLFFFAAAIWVSRALWREFDLAPNGFPRRGRSLILSLQEWSRRAQKQV